MKIFAELLTKKREEMGLLKKEVAELLGWTAMYYSRFEKGHLLPTKHNAKLFADFLEITENEVLEFVRIIKGDK